MRWTTIPVLAAAALMTGCVYSNGYDGYGYDDGGYGRGYGVSSYGYYDGYYPSSRYYSHGKRHGDHRPHHGHGKHQGDRKPKRHDGGHGGHDDRGRGDVRGQRGHDGGGQQRGRVAPSGSDGRIQRRSVPSDRDSSGRRQTSGTRGGAVGQLRPVKGNGYTGRR